MEKSATFSPCRKYKYALWRHWGGLFAEGLKMSEPKIPKGFVMIYTETYSICMRVDHIVSVAVACGQDHTLHITTVDGENYKVAYNFEEFLKLMSKEMEAAGSPRS